MSLCCSYIWLQAKTTRDVEFSHAVFNCPSDFDLTVYLLQITLNETFPRTYGALRIASYHNRMTMIVLSSAIFFHCVYCQLIPFSKLQNTTFFISQVLLYIWLQMNNNNLRSSVNACCLLLPPDATIIAFQSNQLIKNR